MTPLELISASRCPPTIPLGDFGLWRIFRQSVDAPGRTGADLKLLGPFKDMTVLTHFTMATLNQDHGETVMEDSYHELARHLPILRGAYGRVLVTGMGLGCVIRGLAAKPEIEKITVIEKDRQIIERIGAEFCASPVVDVIEADAFKFKPGHQRWDFSWHDIWAEGKHEAVLHGKLLTRYAPYCRHQGAWGLPGWFRRRLGGDLVVSSSYRSIHVEA